MNSMYPTGFWAREEATAPEDIGFSACCRVGNNIYYVGCGAFGQNDAVYMYDPYAKTWTPGLPVPATYFGHSCVHAGSKLYYIGGKNGITYNKTLHIYDIVKQAWTVGQPMPTTMYYGTSIVINNKIYCLGYSPPSSGTNANIMIYDIDTDSWETGAALPKNMSSCHSGDLYEDYIITSSNSYLYLYNIKESTWKTIPKPYAASPYTIKQLMDLSICLETN